jgi:hypothetical protein
MDAIWDYLSEAMSKLAPYTHQSPHLLPSSVNSFCHLEYVILHFLGGNTKLADCGLMGLIFLIKLIELKLSYIYISVLTNYSLSFKNQNIF